MVMQMSLVKHLRFDSPVHIICEATSHEQVRTLQFSTCKVASFSMTPAAPDAPKNTFGLVFNDTSCSRCPKEHFCGSFVGAACCNVSLRFEQQAAFSQSSCAHHSFSQQLRTVSLQWTLTHKCGQVDHAGVTEKNIPPFKHTGTATLASHITSMGGAVSLLVTITTDNCTAAKYKAESVTVTDMLIADGNLPTTLQQNIMQRVCHRHVNYWHKSPHHTAAKYNAESVSQTC